jgi:hypothetical protein
MTLMSPTAASAPGLTRRSLFAGSAAGLALFVAGCTSSGGRRDAVVTDHQVDALAAQVTVQQTLVAAYAVAGTAAPSLGTEVADLAAQAGAQLARLKAASPGSRASRSAASASAAAPAVPAGQDPRAWLRGQVTAAADSHAAACLEQSGARAALLGSIAAGLRGQVQRLS